MGVKDKKVGIMTYIDNSQTMLEEFSWLHKSWIHSGCWETSDLIVVHHPALVDTLPKEPGIILIPFAPVSQHDPQFHNYHFINSIACLSGPHIDTVLKRYQWLLRTDADVFLTHHLANFTPLYPVHGRGNYYFSVEFREKMLDFCHRHGVEHWQRFGCGHSVMLSSELMITFLQRQIYWCRKLVEDFGTDKANWGRWPGWYRGVLTMYAAEITANERWHTYLRDGRERILDMPSSTAGNIDTLTLHIHATQETTQFSKFRYRAGDYADIDPDTLDCRRVDQYCMWICLTSIEAIKAQAAYSG
ncbi:hypothetical protein yaldo0001_15200 [Yersinia aldovae ATCC 35236]|uniref:DUF7164 domain-containing protein n=2 Tax=Yersinia aldovae TaxID=29483 RepID=A0A0T9TDQ9_YERAL|nr:hypothetical protein [Yersinia aldovae]EEP97231.1 hypothetical protein yaldo0001_15200 [Yersinia aldovae ATCC 35236]AJJ65153.1 hypothetical protein AT01_681 [Yersinia aldovae 670-83]CNJ35613.1 Uncharacterised protein [Yersinia aldovae]CNK76252.1 Uncharacterised protein [Yersinia aldovae]CNK96099.1 Uncharacterised protein [Yersinia aldovae]